MIRRIMFVFIALVIVFTASPILAANGQTKLPNRLTYAKEWLNLNLFTWKTQSKISLANRYATDRAEEINTIVDQNNSSALTDLTSRYSELISKVSQLIPKNKVNSTALLDTTKTDVISQQKILSEARQTASAENDQKIIASTQEKAVNALKQNITDIENTESATNFDNQIVSVWRDPKNTVKDEKETRVYAAGTSENGTIDEGVIIDGGEAKISKDSGGNLKIEYAPGTGPSSVTADNGKKLWKIQMSDGTTIDSYTSGGNVVVGKSSGTASNVVVNTVAGGTSGTANVVVGNGTGSAGTVVVGGKSVVTSGDAGTSTGVGNTVNNSTNSTGSSAGQTIQTTP